MEKVKYEQINVRLGENTLKLIDKEIQNSNGVYNNRSHYLRCCAILCSKYGLQNVIAKTRG